MEFKVEFYETESGFCPVKEFLLDLKRRNPNDFASLVRSLEKLGFRCYHRAPLSKFIGDDLYELRHVGKLNSRVIYFFMKGQTIVAVHGIRNKATSIPKRDRQTAIQRMNDWKNRHREIK